MVIIINASIIVVVIGVPIVQNNFIFIGDQKIGGDDQSFVKVLFMLSTDMCFISGTLLARHFKVSSEVLDISRDFIKLKLLILEYDLLKPYLFSIVSIIESTFNLFLDGRTKVIALALHPSGK